MLDKRAQFSASNPQISVLIVSHNSGQHLQTCLNALARQRVTDFEVLLVDNASQDGSIDALDRSGIRLTLIRSKQNLGFAAANNLAAQSASGNWLATLNPDAFAEPDWLHSLMLAVDRYPGVVMFGSTQVDAADTTRLDGAGDPYHAFGFAWRGGKGRALDTVHLTEGEVFGPCAAAALYRRDLFLAHGGFDERYFCYYEDVDLAFRIRLAGGSCIQVPSARVHHVGSGTGRGASRFSVYHITRNRVWTFVKNMPGPLLWALALPAILVLLQSLLLKPGRAKLQGLQHAWQQRRPILETRRKIHPSRGCSTLNILRALTWSPFRAARRDTDIRPFTPRASPASSSIHPQSVCALVVTYQGGALLNETLPPLLRQVEQLIVIDNGSEPATRNILAAIEARHPGKMRLYYNDRNLGLARAQNQGIARALEQDYPWILLMDQDSTVRPGMVASLLHAYLNEPRSRPLGLLAPRITREGMRSEQQLAVSQHPLHFSRRGFAGQPVLHDLLFAIASGSLIPAQVLQQIGAMRSEFFIDYVDIDFCLRLRRAGYDIVAVRDAQLDHRLGATTEQKILARNIAVTHHAPLRRYYIYRNRIRLWRSYLWRRPAWVGFELLASLHDLVKITRFEQQRGKKLRYIAKGAWDGLRGVGDQRQE